MNYSFDHIVATNHGVNEAIFLNNLAFWIRTNWAKNKNFHDGRTWSYNSYAGFIKYFPFWTEKQIRTIVNSCEKQGLLCSSNYNTAKYDRTKWYSLTDKGLKLFPDLICPNGQMEETDQAVPSAQMGRPIPDINTNIKQDNNICVNEETETTPDHCNAKASRNLLAEKLKPYTDTWNELAVPKGCPKIGKDKRQLKTIERHIKQIETEWENKFNPESFRIWLTKAIDSEFFMLTNFKHPMDICLRYKHFTAAYDKIMNTN
jgi:DNA-binding PadR family transcriptional regulator